MFVDDTTVTVDETTYVSSTDSPKTEVMIEPRLAAVELIGVFKRIAAALSPTDRSTQEDLVQEMCLAMLECSKPREKRLLIQLAIWRAKDYLRWWLTPMTKQVPLSPAALAQRLKR